MTSEDPSRTELLSFHDGNQLNNDLFYYFFCPSLLNSVQLLPFPEITSQINNQLISLCFTLYYFGWEVGRWVEYRPRKLILEVALEISRPPG